MKHKFVKKIEAILFIISAILILFSAYFIGNMTALESRLSDIQIIYPDAISVQPNSVKESVKPDKILENTITSQSNSIEKQIVASKNGKRYYYSNCNGLNRIKLENRVYFETEKQAKDKGLTLASGCKKL